MDGPIRTREEVKLAWSNLDWINRRLLGLLSHAFPDEKSPSHATSPSSRQAHQTPIPAVHWQSGGCHWQSGGCHGMKSEPLVLLVLLVLLELLLQLLLLQLLLPVVEGVEARPRTDTAIPSSFLLSSAKTESGSSGRGWRRGWAMRWWRECGSCGGVWLRGKGLLRRAGLGSGWG